MLVQVDALCLSAYIPFCVRMYMCVMVGRGKGAECGIISLVAQTSIFALERIAMISRI